MGWIGIVLQLIPVVMKLMQVAEALFAEEPESGKLKKSYVMEAIKAMLDAGGKLTGQPEIFAKIEKAISLLIDAACIFLFNSGKEKS